MSEFNKGMNNLTEAENPSVQISMDEKEFPIVQSEAYNILDSNIATNIDQGDAQYKKADITEVTRERDSLNTKIEEKMRVCESINNKANIQAQPGFKRNPLNNNLSNSEFMGYGPQGAVYRSQAFPIQANLNNQNLNNHFPNVDKSINQANLNHYPHLMYDYSKNESDKKHMMMKNTFDNMHYQNANMNGQYFYNNGNQNNQNPQWYSNNNTNKIPEYFYNNSFYNLDMQNYIQHMEKLNSIQSGKNIQNQPLINQRDHIYSKK